MALISERLDTITIIEDKSGAPNSVRLSLEKGGKKTSIVIAGIQDGTAEIIEGQDGKEIKVKTLDGAPLNFSIKAQVPLFL